MERQEGQHFALQRIRRVISRPVDAEVPQVIGATVEHIPTSFEAPIGEVLKSPEDPVIDPTHYGKRRRRRSHARQYQLAQVATALSMLAAAAGVLCVVLGERRPGQIIALGSLAAAGIAVALSWRSRLSSRVLGYAVASVVLGVLSVGASTMMPPAWFEDGMAEEGTGHLQSTARPRGAAVKGE